MIIPFPGTKVDFRHSPLNAGLDIIGRRAGIPSGQLDILGQLRAGMLRPGRREGIPSGRGNLEILGQPLDNSAMATEDFAVFGNVIPIDSPNRNDGTAGDEFLVFGALFSIPDGGVTESGTNEAFMGDDLCGSIFSDIAKAAAAPVKGAVKAAGRIAHGDFKGAGKALVVDPLKAELKVGKQVIRSPIVKTAAAGVAIVYPPVGVPAVAALAIADKAMRTKEGMRGTPAQRAAMKRVIANTERLAKSGNRGAQAFMAQMDLASKIRKTQEHKAKTKGKGQPGYFVTGRTVKRGVFRQV